MMQEWNEQGNIGYMRILEDQVLNLECTQDIKLAADEKDVGSVLGVWGQAALRNKEWRSGTVTAGGGVMVWVLYTAPGEKKPCILRSWVPFNARWDMEENEQDGVIHLYPLVRSAEVRFISPRKLAAKISVSIRMQAFCETEWENAVPEDLPEKVECKFREETVHLIMEAGEKSFTIEGNFDMDHPAGELVCLQIEPGSPDRRVAGNKLVFRGNANIKALYLDQEGMVRCQSWEIHFSQVEEFDREWDSSAQGNIGMCVTSLDGEIDGDGKLALKAGLTAQFCITQGRKIRLIEDAYLPGGKTELNGEEKLLCPGQIKAGGIAHGQTQVAAVAGEIVDLTIWAGHPMGNGAMGCSAQVLYRDGEGGLRSASAKWDVPRDGGWEGCSPSAVRADAHIGGNGVTLEAQMQMEGVCGREITMQTIRKIQVLQENEKKQRPSVMLRRMGPGELWTLAKECGSTMEAIREANQLSGEPEAGQMLLIPLVQS